MLGGGAAGGEGRWGMWGRGSVDEVVGGGLDVVEGDIDVEV